MPSQNEIWAQHPEYRDYWISCRGRVMRGTQHGRWIGRVIKGWINRGGYRRVRITHDGATFDRYIHTLVLESHVGPRGGAIHEIQACHWDGDPSNAQLENLRWDSLESNYADQVEHGTAAIGERNGRAKLTADEKEAIMRSHDRHTTLARKFGVDERTIRRVRAEGLK